MATHLSQFWAMRGHLREGRGWLSTMLEGSEGHAPTILLGDAHNAAGAMALIQGDHAAALRHHERSIAIRRELSDQQGIAGSLNNLANVLRQLGNAEEAAAAFRDALQINRLLGNRSWAAINLSSLGLISVAEGDASAAFRYLEESLGICRELGNPQNTATALGVLADMAIGVGDQIAARSYLEENLRICLEIGDRSITAIGLAQMAAIENLACRPERAVRLSAAVQALGDAIGQSLPLEVQPQYDACVETARASLSPAAFVKSWDAGCALSWEDAIMDALA
jgi:tetratricopeptide (TPR) repeat protein